MLNLIDRGGQGSVLILLHGFLGSGDDWLPVLPALCQHFHCWTVDLPGHGGSAPEACSLAGIADVIYQCLKAHHISPAYVLGYSLGGRGAMTLADRYPAVVYQLVLEGAHPGLLNETDQQTRLKSDQGWAHRFANESLSVVLEGWYRQHVFSSLDEVSRQALVSERATSNRGAVLADVLMGCSLSVQKDYRPSLRNKIKSVVYLVGEHDLRFQLLADQLFQESGVQKATVLNAGHNAHRDAPTEFVKALLTTLTPSF